MSDRASGTFEVANATTGKTTGPLPMDMDAEDLVFRLNEIAPPGHHAVAEYDDGNRARIFVNMDGDISHTGAGDNRHHRRRLARLSRKRRTGE